MVEAPTDQIDAMHAAVQPVIDDLRRDVSTRAAIDRIESLAKSTDTPAFTMPSACLPRTGDAARLPSQTPAPKP